jgi:4-amino-4-deoxy-L-arabinose transferase-like glycosyltransferase
MATAAPWSQFSAATGQLSGIMGDRASSGQTRVSGPLFDACAAALLFAIVAVLYFNLHSGGAIWWSDASRNALNGAFVLDFIRTMPASHPMSFAYDYYRQWPALTILFYPPLFYVALAAVYAIFGVSESSALLTACLFLFALGWGAFRLSRRWLGPLASLAAAILTIGMPEMAFWGQQPMLDVPSYALLMWCAVYLFRGLDTGRPAMLLYSVLFLVLAIYTKYNAAFFAVPVAVALLSARGWNALTDRRIWQAIGFGAVLMAPLIAIFFVFARYNLEQAASVPTMTMPRWSIAGWSYYASVIPASVTWPVLALGLLYLPAALFQPRFRIGRTDSLFLAAWVLAGYAFYSLVAVKEPRYDLFVVYPVAIAPLLLIDRALLRFSWRWVAALGLALAILVAGQIIRPAPYVTGMREAADTVAKLAPKDSNVGFWGRWDGSFIFDMRAYEGRPDLGVLRLDKLLLSDVVVSFDLGVKDKGLSPEEILDALRTYHVQYVVFQTQFREDIPSVAAMGRLLHSDRFEPVGNVKIAANDKFSYLTDLTLYRFREELPPGRVLPPVEIKLLGKSLR